LSWGFHFAERDFLTDTSPTRAGSARNKKKQLRQSDPIEDAH
jgi:hypothetical protein